VILFFVGNPSKELSRQIGSSFAVEVWEKMPANMPPTMAEREAELAALQSAFDEYIASSRELEEELDAELAKMRKLS